MADKRKKSPIWNYFAVGEDTKFATCNLCRQAISRGGRDTKTYNTTNLVNHLKTKHIELYAEYEIEKGLERGERETDKKASTKQLSLLEASERVRKWDINDARAQRIHRRVMEMIALDSQPFSVVDDPGFVRLVHELEPRYSLPSRKYITEKILPQIHSGVKAAVKDQLAGVPSVLSFTTDAWSRADGGASLLSLTAHWITDSFMRKSAVLQVLPLEESHTGEHLAQKYLEMLADWEIRLDQVHLVLRDNAANMAKAMRDASLPSTGCFAHTLQLVVHDGVLSQRMVMDTLAVCRKIVGHFKHSATAYGRLQRIQQNLGLSERRLQQDVPTRWNSSLYMLQVVIEQKMALAAYASEYSISQFTANQLDIIGKVIAALSPIEEITKAVSADSASVSLVIPFVRMLSKTMEKHDNDRGVRTMKAEMLKSLKTRFADVERNEHLVIATLLDPRFKDKFFSSPGERATARQLLERKKSEVGDTSAATPERCPSPKRPHTDLWQSFSEILEEAGQSATEFNPEKQLLQLVGRELYTFSYIGQRYLSAPATSVPSERLFSGAGDVYYDRRNRLAPERAEMLLFIKNNFALINEV